MFHLHYSTVLFQRCVLTVQKRTHCNNDYQICTKQLEIQNKKGEKNHLKDTTFQRFKMVKTILKPCVSL